MGLVEIIQLILRNKKWVFIFPLLTALAVFFMVRNTPGSYTSDMVIYTGIASGYNLENDLDGKVDYHQVNSKFDNLIQTITSNETRKEVALRLLSELLCRPGDLKRTVKAEDNPRMEWLLTSKLAAENGNDPEKTYLALAQRVNETGEMTWHELVLGKYKNPFNIRALADISATRIGFSDMIRVEYTATDALVAQKTLNILCSVFMRKYKNIQVGEAFSAVKYFEEQTALALGRLQQAEMTLKVFRTTNKVINYYEQTKYIADQKEDYEMRESQLSMDLQGYQDAYAKIMAKLDNRSQLRLKSEEVMKKKNELSARLNAMDLGLVRDRNTPGADADAIQEMKDDLRQSIVGWNNMNNSTEGVPGKMLLDQWLELTVSLEETRARLKTLKGHKAEFEKIYDQYAPMGSDLNKLERDVDVAEKEYLNLLHNLNQARLRERNLQVSQHISLIDPAQKPIVPNASKKFLLVVAAFISALVLVILVLILREYLDESIGNPVRLTRLTGLRTCSAFVRGDNEPGINYPVMENRSLERWSLSLIELEKRSGNSSACVLMADLHGALRSSGVLRTKLLDYLNQHGRAWSAKDVNHLEMAAGNTFIELPGANPEILPAGLAENAGMIFLVVDAAKKIGDYELDLISRWKALERPVQTILVNAKAYQIARFFGEIPKNRSRFRIWIKERLSKYTH